MPAGEHDVAASATLAPAPAATPLTAHSTGIRKVRIRRISGLNVRSNTSPRSSPTVCARSAPGAEPAPGPRQQDRPALRIRVRIVDRRAQRRMQRIVEHIELVRPFSVSVR